jgi:rhamnulokinase
VSRHQGRPVTVVAVDLGASSGRVMLARVGPDRLDLHEVHRFGNEPVELAGHDGSHLHWDAVRLYTEVLAGLRAVAGTLGPGERLAGIGIDSWAVDYGLLDGAGELLGTPYCYRDARTAEGVRRTRERISAAELYRENGLQHLPFTTLHQLAAEPADRLDRARTLLLLPDLLGFWLTGESRAEVTNASTTGLLDVRTRDWNRPLLARLGLPDGLLPELVRPGEQVGTLLPQVAAAAGLPAGTPVLAVGSHDTASAVVGVPAAGPGFGYISCGTWSLVGLELAAPVLTEQSQAANFTNEGGVDGTVRFLRNVMGLWLLNESVREWRQDGPDVDLGALLQAAAALPDGGPVLDPDDPVFLPPGDMDGRVRRALEAAGGSPRADRPALARAVLDGLAAAYARALDDARRLSGARADVIHLVGGGSRNTLLCRLTAAATGLPVLAGPVEATALGNVLVQARALGALTGDLAALRDLVRRTQPPTRYDP